MVDGMYHSGPPSKKTILLAVGCAAKGRLSTIRGLCQTPCPEKLTCNG